MSIIIRVYNLVKDFKTVRALKGISFEVNKGEIFALLGPNGAGKTTTVKILSCVYKPTVGNVTVLDMEVPKDCKRIREKIGVMPQDYQGFMDMTVEENIEYFAKLYREHLNIDEILEEFGLREVRNKRLRYLSGGMRRRVGLASTFVGNNELIFLDEPTLGLDPKARKEFWELIKKLKAEKGVTIFFTTHYLEEAQRYSSRVGVLINGQMVRLSSPEQLIEEFKKENLEEAYLELIGKYEGGEGYS
ncbi:MAG: ABC transporter ATP-binding protein [Sulfolobaceae archaeon]|nr:ABC transporter ATP-binding protein [Sulfolobaceae archaeon]